MGQIPQCFQNKLKEPELMNKYNIYDILILFVFYLMPLLKIDLKKLKRKIY